MNVDTFKFVYVNIAQKTMKVSVLQISETRSDKVLNKALWEVISSGRRVIWLYLFGYYSMVLKIQNISYS